MTDAELRAAIRASRARERTAVKIRAVRYDRERDSIGVDLSTGATLTVARAAVPGFAKAPADMLGDVAITAGGEGLWSDSADDGVLLEQLVALAAGEPPILYSSIATRQP